MNDYRRTTAGQQEPLDSDQEPTRAGNRKSSGSNSSEWLVNVSDDVVVPMITSEVVEALRTGRLSNTSLVWRVGMHDWSPLADVPQLRLAAGPSALPPKASFPGPIVHNSQGTAPKSGRRNTLPMGFASAGPRSAAPHSAAPREDADALAVYARPSASLTFTESARADWQGTSDRASTSSNGPSPVPPGAGRRLTPVPPVTARLTGSQPSSLPPNTLSPTTSEARVAASGRGPSAWADRSVVFASELRAVKKTSKRLIVWAAIGSATAASLCTFWFAHSSLESAGSAPPAPSVAARSPEPHAVEPPTPLVAPPQSMAPVVSARPAAKAAPVRYVRRMKRVPVIAPAPTAAPAPVPLTTEDSSSDAKPASSASAALAPGSESPDPVPASAPTPQPQTPSALTTPAAPEVLPSPAQPAP